jgi:glycosyltransferase involved in cell wall biosynthesis
VNGGKEVTVAVRGVKIGVVVAVRDQAAYLGEALDSIAAQTVLSEAVVVVDDGSVDGSGAVARARGVRTIRTAGIGPGGARGAGAAALHTDLLAFLDGDDRYFPTHHATLLAALEQSGADAVCGMARRFADDGSEAAERYAVGDELQVGRSPGGLLVRRARYEAVGGFQANAGRNELFELFSRLPDLVPVPEVVYERRIHGENRSIVARAEVHAEYLSSAREAILRARREGRA